MRRSRAMREYAGASMTLTPWAAQALNDDERHAISVRAVELHCRLVVGKSDRAQTWVIRLSSWDQASYLERRPYAGLNLAACIGAVLDEYAAVRETWTAEEIIQIANQSGMAVSRG